MMRIGLRSECYHCVCSIVRVNFRNYLPAPGAAALGPAPPFHNFGAEGRWGRGRQGPWNSSLNESFWNNFHKGVCGDPLLCRPVEFSEFFGWNRPCKGRRIPALPFPPKIVTMGWSCFCWAHPWPTYKNSFSHSSMLANVQKQ